MKKIISMLAGASLLAIAGGVSADPVTLSEVQMDNVSAGGVYVYSGVGTAGAGSFAVANLLGITGADTGVLVTPVVGFVGAGAVSGAIAISSYNPLSPINGAVAASGAGASSSLF